MVALIDGLPQTLVTDPCPFIVSAEHNASVLFDPDGGRGLAGGAGRAGARSPTLYIVAPDQERRSMALKARGPRRCWARSWIRRGGEAPAGRGSSRRTWRTSSWTSSTRSAMTLKRAFREILPLLWLKAGAVGPRPELARRRARARGLRAGRQ